jgi:general secretion pathway protein D
LIRDKVSETTSKIPILGDIPVLGWLFKSRDSRIEKTNLLVFLTPHIVRQYEKVRAILDKKLKERDDFIEENAGGEDPLRHKRDDMIRSLPDLKDLASKVIPSRAPLVIRLP